MADFQLTSTWEEIDEAGQNRVFYVVMDSASTALSTAADVYAALSAVPTRAVILIDNDGAQALKAPSSPYLDTVTFILPTESGYTKYVLDNTGHVATTSYAYSGSFVVNIYTSGSALACDKTLSEIADALSTNGVVGCITPAGVGMLAYADTNVAKFNVIDTSGSAPVLTVYAVDRFGSVTETDIAIGGGSGSATEIFGFVSIDAYRSFRVLHPDDIGVGDYVWIRGVTIAGASHTLYKFVAAEVTDHLQQVYAIDDPYLVTVTNTNGYVADKTYAQILAAYNDGQRPVLMTEFGQMVPVVGADSNGIRFSGAIDAGSDGFWIVTYTIGPSGVTARGVMTEFVPVFLSVSNGVYDVVSWPSFISGNTILFAIQAMQNGAKVAVVVPGATDAYIHPMNYYVGTSEIHFAGIERETISGVDYLRAVTYVIGVSLQHVQRIVGQTVLAPTNNDIGKVWTALAAGKAGWVTPSGGGGGISKTVVTISSGTSDTSPADIYSAYQSGNVIECVAEGVSGWLAYPPSSTEAVFIVIDTDSGRRLYLYTVASDSSVISISWNIGTADVPETVTLSGTTPTISVWTDNTIYTGGELTSLTVSAIPLNGMFTLIFDSGSTATNLVLPEYDAQNPTARYVDWGGFTVEASKHYEISINCVGGVGYLVGKGW